MSEEQGNEIKNSPHHTRELKQRHKDFLIRIGLNPNNYVFMEQTADNYKFFNLVTGRIEDIRR